MTLSCWPHVALPNSKRSMLSKIPAPLLLRNVQNNSSNSLKLHSRNLLLNPKLLELLPRIASKAIPLLHSLPISVTPANPSQLPLRTIKDKSLLSKGKHRHPLRLLPLIRNHPPASPSQGTYPTRLNHQAQTLLALNRK